MSHPPSPSAPSGRTRSFWDSCLFFTRYAVDPLEIKPELDACAGAYRPSEPGFVTPGVSIFDKFIFKSYLF